MTPFILNSVGRGQSAVMRASVSCALASLLLFAAPAGADAMRCGSKLVSDGDSRSEVRALCGEPSDVQTRSILRRPYYNYQGRITFYGDGLVEIPVEIWTYNFGPYKLMRRIRFVDGQIEEIETLGYGYRDESREALRDTYK